jgi:hypothetical protein
MMAVYSEASAVVASDTGAMRQRLSAAEVTELAELLETRPSESVSWTKSCKRRPKGEG